MRTARRTHRASGRPSRPAPLLVALCACLLLAACAGGSRQGAAGAPTAAPGASAEQATAAPRQPTAPPGDAAIAPTPPTGSLVPQPSAELPGGSPAAEAGPPTPAPRSGTATAGAAADRPFDPNGLTLQVQPFVRGLEQPVNVATAGDGSGDLFVVEKPGRIRLIQQGQLRDAPFLDITGLVGSRGSEQGLLGLAFHPGFPQNPYVYVNYTDTQGDTNIVRYAVAQDDPRHADPNSAKLLLKVDQPYANHNGGNTIFGPDGYLWIGMGDGGSGGDPQNRAQNLGELLGKILRLDVDHGDPYAIPPDNPFKDRQGARPEIWSYGMRNPWRFSFDPPSGRLYVADVGQNAYEEVDVVTPDPVGLNFGWPIMEGMHCFRDPQCSTRGYVLPVAEYPHAQGCSITGGGVYRGSASPALQGVYLYGDYCSGRIWGLGQDANGTWQAAELAQTDLQISTFGMDEAGEMYVAGLGDGTLYRIVGQRGA